MFLLRVGDQVKLSEKGLDYLLQEQDYLTDNKAVRDILRQQVFTIEYLNICGACFPNKEICLCDKLVYLKDLPEVAFCSDELLIHLISEAV